MSTKFEVWYKYPSDGYPRLWDTYTSRSDAEEAIIFLQASDDDRTFPELPEYYIVEVEET